MDPKDSVIKELPVSGFLTLDLRILHTPYKAENWL